MTYAVVDMKPCAGLWKGACVFGAFRHHPCTDCLQRPAFHPSSSAFRYIQVVGGLTPSSALQFLLIGAGT